jgi:hypothetical protein
VCAAQSAVAPSKVTPKLHENVVEHCGELDLLIEQTTIIRNILPIGGGSCLASQPFDLLIENGGPDTEFAGRFGAPHLVGLKAPARFGPPTSSLDTIVDHG